MAYDDYGKYYRVKLSEKDWKVLERNPGLMNFMADMAETIQSLRADLWSQAQEHKKEVDQLKSRIRELERRFLKDSHNSHRPTKSCFRHDIQILR